ncbi:MAG TPA: flagellar hook-basal body protein [Candidatus Avamphibacillus sp.]|nr:flagellar hook-basal body protein [Candidatus Avamphibacillus sp.]
MLRGFYTAASGMIAQQRYQEALSNNIANANTPGYKADQSTLRSFPEMLMEQTGSKNIPTTQGLNMPVNRTVGPINTGVYVQEMVPNFVQGDLRETGISTDIALINGTFPDEMGNIFFTVQDENGDVRLTRNGNFTVDGQGYLVTSQGYYVLDQNEDPIQTGGSEFIISEDGVLLAGADETTLGISYVANANELEKEGNGLFNGEAEDVPADATYEIQQGFLERSNVDSMQMMTQMMGSYRMFETNQKVLKAYDESMGKAVTEIGRLA